MHSVNGNFFRETCAEVREKGDTTVSNLSNIHFFIMIIIFTFSPPSTLVARPAWQGNHRRAYSPPTISSKTRRWGGASCFEFCTKIGLLFFRFRFDTVWIRRDFALFFIYCTCRNPNKTSSTVPHRPPARRSTAAFAVLLQHTLHALRQYNKSSYSNIVACILYISYLYVCLHMKRIIMALILILYAHNIMIWYFFKPSWNWRFSDGKRYLPKFPVHFPWGRIIITFCRPCWVYVPHAPPPPPSLLYT